MYESYLNESDSMYFMAAFDEEGEYRKLYFNGTSSQIPIDVETSLNC